VQSALGLDVCVHRHTRRCQTIETQTITICSEKQARVSFPFPSPALFFPFFPLTFRRGSRRRQRWRERRRRAAVSEAAVRHANRTPDSAPGVVSSLFLPRFLYAPHSPSGQLVSASRQQVYPSSEAHADMHEPLYSRYHNTTQEQARRGHLHGGSAQVPVASDRRKTGRKKDLACWRLAPAARRWARCVTAGVSVTGFCRRSRIAARHHGCSVTRRRRPMIRPSPAALAAPRRASTVRKHRPEATFADESK
jgi:hypothetical protein